MNRAETALALTLAAAFDRRTIGEADVEAWHTVLADLAFDDVKEAVAGHYATSRDWLMPADVRERVKAIRAARLAAIAEEPPDADPDDVPTYLEALRAGRRATADGTERPRPVAALLGQVGREVGA